MLPPRLRRHATTTAPTGIALAGATIAVNRQCQFSVTVTGAAAGHTPNTPERDSTNAERQHGYS